MKDAIEMMDEYVADVHNAVTAFHIALELSTNKEISGTELADAGATMSNAFCALAAHSLLVAMMPVESKRAQVEILGEVTVHVIQELEKLQTEVKGTYDNRH